MPGAAGSSISFKPTAHFSTTIGGGFLREHGFLVEVSLDGPQAVHDAYRVDRGGQPTFARVMQGIEVLKKHGVSLRTLTMVSRTNVERPLPVYRFLRKLGAGFMQFVPLVERTAGPAETALGLTLAAPPENATWAAWKDDAHMLTLWSVRPGDYGEFLCIIFDEWVRRDAGSVSVGLFDSALSQWAGAGPGRCPFGEECGRAAVIEHNGDVYACDHYVYPRYRLGNILESDLPALLDAPVAQALREAKRTTLPRQCRECAVRFACNGGCPKDRFLHTADGEAGLNFLCEAYQQFFHHIDPAMTTLAGLLAENRALAEIIHLPRSKWARGRL
ncbi:MAG: SPASM domain-containing protein [Opitutaceae bacterium]|nr:SPASM domain-containing protein [Opitutaceae bacterium]